MPELTILDSVVPVHTKNTLLEHSQSLIALATWGVESERKEERGQGFSSGHSQGCASLVTYAHI